LEQVVQKELAVAPAGVISNTPLRRIAPTLPSINILFFIAVLSFSPVKSGIMGYCMPTQPFFNDCPAQWTKAAIHGSYLAICSLSSQLLENMKKLYRTCLRQTQTVVLDDFSAQWTKTAIHRRYMAS
jgi:hypothetical protein